MNRRIFNGLIVWRVLADPDSPGLGSLVEIMREVLMHNMVPAARARFGSEVTAEEVAGAAAQVGLDRVASGRMYRDTATYESQTLLREGARRRRLVWNRVRQQAQGRSPQPVAQVSAWRDWPPWLDALYRLLLLSRRPWVYLSLFTARRPRRSWHGELARLYLGSQTRQATLTRAKAPLRQAIDELNATLQETRRPAAEGVAPDWFEELDRADPAPEASAELVLASLAGRNPFTADLPAVQDAVAALSGLANPPGRILAAYRELAAGLDGGPYLADGALRDWLEALPALPANDRPPSEVLTSILSATPNALPERVSAQAGPAAPLANEALLQALGQACPPNGFEQAVLGRISSECRRERLLEALAPALPPADALDRETLEALACRLEGWRSFVAGALPPHREQFVWVEIPARIRTTDILGEAGSRVRRAISTPSGPWSQGLAGSAVLAALLSLTLDQFADQMADFRQHDLAAGPANQCIEITPNGGPCHV